MPKGGPRNGAVRHLGRARPRRGGSRGISLVLSVACVGVLLWASLGYTAASVSPAAKVPTITPHLQRALPAPPAFWGMNLGADHPPGSNTTATLGETPTKVLVYPSGNASERMDIANNTIYAVGSQRHAAVTIQSFISDCEAIACQAIIELPMEIDSPSTTAWEAAYIVDHLGFQPAYFAYGNEASHWLCFGESWASEAAGQPCNSTGTTPSGFANETAATIADVRAALGSSAPPAVCLEAGTGTGWQNVTPWLRALEANAYDRSACAAYGIHNKPAHSQLATPTLANFYATLTGPQGLVADYQNLSSLTVGRPLFVTEVGWSTPGSIFTPVFTGTWAENVLQAALLVQAMQNRLPVMGWWAWNEGASLDAYANATFGMIYTTLFPQLGSTWHTTQFHGQRGIFAEATQQGSTSWSMLLVSVNTQKSFHIALSGSGFPDSGKATVYTVTASGLLTKTIWNLSKGFLLPSQSVVLVSTA